MRKAVDPGQAGTLVLAEAAPCVLAAVVTAVKAAAAVFVFSFHFFAKITTHETHIIT